MSAEYTIYNFLKQELANDYSISFNFENLDELDENKCGIFLLGSITSTRSLSKLNIKQYNNQLVFNINTDSTQEGFKRGYDFCNFIITKLMSILNKEYENLFISHFDLTTSTTYLGRNNELGINKFSINMILYYTIL